MRGYLELLFRQGPEVHLIYQRGEWQLRYLR